MFIMYHIENNPLEFITILVTVITFIIGLLFSLSQSSKANKKADKANEISEKALAFSEKTVHETNKPELILSSVIIEGEKAEIFTGKNMKWMGGEDFPKNSNYLNIIKNQTANSFCFEYFDSPTKYVFVNLCDKNTLDEDIVFMKNAITISIESKGVPITRFSIIDGYAMKNAGEFIPPNFNFTDNATMKVDANDQTIILPMAYAAPKGKELCMDLAKIAVWIEKTAGDIIIYPNNPNSDCATDITLFDETAFLISCKTSEREKPYEFTLIIDKNLNSGKWTIPAIQFERTMFDENDPRKKESITF